MKAKLLLIPIVAAVAALTVPRLFLISVTPSLSHRLFRVERNFSSIRTGDTVVFEHCDRVTGGRNIRMAKLVGCDEGDELTVDAAKRYFCNGAYVGTARDTSRDGIPVKNFLWSGRIPGGFFLPLGESSDSYDGRYYGLLEKRRVLMKAYPLL